MKEGAKKDEKMRSRQEEIDELALDESQYQWKQEEPIVEGKE